MEKTNELAIIPEENEQYDDEGEKSLLAMIVLFFLFRSIFHSTFLALLLSYTLAPRKKNENTTSEE